MHVEVLQDVCISCGTCISIAPETFEWGDEDKATAKTPDVPSDYESVAHEAVESCPTAAIKEQ